MRGARVHQHVEIGQRDAESGERLRGGVFVVEELHGLAEATGRAATVAGGADVVFERAAEAFFDSAEFEGVGDFAADDAEGFVQELAGLPRTKRAGVGPGEAFGEGPFEHPRGCPPVRGDGGCIARSGLSWAYVSARRSCSSNSAFRSASRRIVLMLQRTYRAASRRPQPPATRAQISRRLASSRVRGRPRPLGFSGGAVLRAGSSAALAGAVLGSECMVCLFRLRFVYVRTLLDRIRLTEVLAQFQLKNWKIAGRQILLIDTKKSHLRDEGRFDIC